MFKLIAILTVFTSAVYANELKNFESDYCTYFPEGTILRPGVWQDCCFNHDLRYWFGGTQADMDKADLKLRSCVSKKAGSFYGNMMYYGVRAGHYSPIKNKRKWSWGWKTKRSGELSIEEKTVINKGLDALDLDEVFLKEFRVFYSL